MQNLLSLVRTSVEILDALSQSVRREAMPRVTFCGEEGRSRISRTTVGRVEFDKSLAV